MSTFFATYILVYEQLLHSWFPLSPSLVFSCLNKINNLFFNNKKATYFILFSKQTTLAGSRLSSSSSSFNQHCPRSICLFNISDLAFGFVCYLFNCNLIEPCRLLACLSLCLLTCFVSRCAATSPWQVTCVFPPYALLPFRPPSPTILISSWRMSFGAASDSYNQIGFPRPSTRIVFDLSVFFRSFPTK